MPTYDFTCPTGHEFEKFYRSIARAPIEVACPVCGKQAHRQMSAGAGLVFKGSGFYITDYGKDGKKDQPAQPHHHTLGNSSATETTPIHSGNGAGAPGNGSKKAAQGSHTPAKSTSDTTSE